MSEGTFGAKNIGLTCPRALSELRLLALPVRWHFRNKEYRSYLFEGTLGAKGLEEFFEGLFSSEFFQQVEIQKKKDLKKLFRNELKENSTSFMWVKYAGVDFIGNVLKKCPGGLKRDAEPKKSR